MRYWLAGLLVTALVLVSVVPVLAHHSFAAQYDRTKSVDLKGTVTKVEWMNPHVYFYLDVTDEGGKVINWALEMGAPSALQRSGWNRNLMKVGDQVIVKGSLAKDGTHLANARSVVMASTGKELGAASSEGATP
jgi:hypothetical protein